MMSVLVAPLYIGALGAVLACILAIADSILNNYGEVTVVVNDGKKELRVDGGSTLLHTLAEQEIFIPSACGGKGSCAACKIKVNSDIGPHLPTETPHLLKDELQENIRLACQIKVKTDVSIDIPEELFNVQKFECIVTEIEELTHDIKRVYMAIQHDKEIKFAAGQYAQIIVPPFKWKNIEKKIGKEKSNHFKNLTIAYNERCGNNKQPGFSGALVKGEVNNSETVQRAYSMSLHPSETRGIEMLIRLVPGGIVTTYVHTLLEEGQKIECVGPFGDFYLQDTGAPMICVAGGSGMAPFKSILKEMDLNGELKTREVWYFFGAINTNDLYYVEWLTDLSQKYEHFHFIPALSGATEEEQWTGETGLITTVLDKYLKEEITGAHSEKEGYLCGSPGMLDACMVVMRDNDMREEKIYFDKFA